MTNIMGARARWASTAAFAWLISFACSPSDDAGHTSAATTGATSATSGTGSTATGSTVGAGTGGATGTSSGSSGSSGSSSSSASSSSSVSSGAGGSIDTGGASGTGSSGTGGSGGGGGGSTGAAGASGSGGAAGKGGSSSDAGSSGSTGGAAGNGGTGDAGGTTGQGQLFGSHKFAYPAGTLRPSGGQAALDTATAAYYDKWKASYLKAATCGGNYVLTGGGTGCTQCVTVSEGHGYGMVIVPLMAGHDPNAKALFDGLYTYFRKAPSAITPNLMAWAADAMCKPVSGPDSATDGDLDIAFGLLLADKQWGSAGTVNYLAEAKKVIADIKSAEVNATTHLTMLGDWDTQTAFSTRPSDFMTDHFRSFSRAMGDTAWTQSVDAVYKVISTITSGPAAATGLMPDFVVSTNTTATPAAPNFLESAHDGDYDYNSCRFPWRLGTDYIVSGDARAKAALVKVNTWIRTKAAGNPASILSGYTLAGTGYVDYVDQAFESPFGVAAIAGSGTADQAWLDALWTAIVATAKEDYYSDSIKMMSMIVISGNWWAP